MDTDVGLGSGAKDWRRIRSIRKLHRFRRLSGFAPGVRTPISAFWFLTSEFVPSLEGVLVVNSYTWSGDRPRTEIGTTTEATEGEEQVMPESGPDSFCLCILCGSISESGTAKMLDSE
jgi:hypothetical protein